MFDGLICDECHFLSHLDAIRTRLLLAKNGPFDRAQYIAALSGTPILNRPIEIFPIVNKLNPSVFEETELDKFGSKYCEVRKNVFSGRVEYRGARNEKELNIRLRSTVMCRRLKEDVLTDLPPKIKRILYLEQTSVSLNYTAKEHGLYTAFLNTGVQTKEEQQSLFHVRTILGLLKVEAIVNHAKMILEEQEKILIFGWHREVLARVSAGLAEFNPVVLTGATYISDRQLRVDSFQNDPSVRVFVGSISAAGIGLNLQAASHVIFGEMSWIPGENEQSEDRSHRIGQHKSVVIDYLIFPNSADEHVLKTVNKKAEIIKNVLDAKTELVNAQF
jgi:SWI/SNF-related matrix-associated actin-dependent regulator 1 of chromatin subfamily A